MVFYEAVTGLADKAPLHVAAHRARWRDWPTRRTAHDQPFDNAQEDGAMAVFTTREAAEEFVRGDPFVLHQGNPKLDYPRMERGPRPRAPSRVGLTPANESP